MEQGSRSLGFAGGTLSSPVLVPFGSVAAPAFSFSGNPDTGFHMESAPPNRMGVTVNGSSKWLWSDTALVMIGNYGFSYDAVGSQAQFLGSDAQPGAPFYSFVREPDCGFYWVGANWIGVATAGVARWSWDASGHYICTLDNVYDIGTPARRPRTVDVGTSFGVLGTQVLNTRKTGWGAPTGTATRTTFDTATVTLPQLAERVKALLDDVTTHGLIGP